MRGSELIKAEVGKCQIITTGAQQIDEFLSPGILIGESLNISSINGGKWGELNYFCERLLNRTLSEVSKDFYKHLKGPVEWYRNQKSGPVNIFALDCKNDQWLMNRVSKNI